jgi:hypothetical protein
MVDILTPTLEFGRRWGDGCLSLGVDAVQSQTEGRQRQEATVHLMFVAGVGVGIDFLWWWWKRLGSYSSTNSSGTSGSNRNFYANSATNIHSTFHTDSIGNFDPNGINSDSNANRVIPFGCISPD